MQKIIPQNAKADSKNDSENNSKSKDSFKKVDDNNNIRPVEVITRDEETIGDYICNKILDLCFIICCVQEKGEVAPAIPTKQKKPAESSIMNR